MTRNHLTIHFGTEKTGSKALQRALVHASGKDFVYPLRRSRGVWHEWVHAGLAQMDAGPLRAALEQVPPSGRGVLSYEGLYRLEDAALDLLRDEAAASFSRITAVIVLRRQDEYAASMANQSWKSHRVTCETAEARERSLISGSDPVLDYATTLDRLAARFETVVPLIYDKNRSIVADFAEAAGLEIADPPGSGDPNPAASAIELATLRCVKRLAADDPRLPKIVEETRVQLERRGVRKWLAARRDAPAVALDAADAEAIMRRCARSNEELHRRWFPHRERLFPPSSLPVEKSREMQPRSDVVRRVRRKFGI